MGSAQFPLEAAAEIAGKFGTENDPVAECNLVHMRGKPGHARDGPPAPVDEMQKAQPAVHGPVQTGIVGNVRPPVPDPLKLRTHIAFHINLAVAEVAARIVDDGHRARPGAAVPAPAPAELPADVDPDKRHPRRPGHRSRPAHGVYHGRQKGRVIQPVMGRRAVRVRDMDDRPVLGHAESFRHAAS